MTCAGNCCNTLSQARTIPVALPGTSYNRSCQLPGQAGRGAARSALPVLLPARGMGRGKQSCCRCFILQRACPWGRGAVVEGGTALGSIPTFSGVFSFFTLALPFGEP